MARNSWEDADLQRLRGHTDERGRVGRVLVGILLVGVATFAGAYYLPLFRAHRTLTAEHRLAVGQIQVLTRSLNEVKRELQDAVARRDELETEQKKREGSSVESSSQLDALKADLAGRFDRAARKGLAQVAVSDGTLVVALADAALFTPHKLELSGPGRQLLCELGEAAEKRTLTVSAADVGETDPALVQKYPTAWALRFARVAAVADGLRSKCGVTTPFSLSVAGGSAPGSSVFQGSKLSAERIEFELRPRTR